MFWRGKVKFLGKFEARNKKSGYRYSLILSFKRGYIAGFALRKSDICCAFATVAASFNIKRYFLVVAQASQTGALNSRNVYENIAASAVWCDKAEAFSCVKPFYGACGHIRSLL